MAQRLRRSLRQALGFFATDRAHQSARDQQKISNRSAFDLLSIRVHPLALA